jgi:hypothetical protein
MSGARYDKYDPISGGFRAALAADLAATNAGNPIGVGLDSSGNVVPGAGNTGIIGALCTTRAMKATEIVDVMTDGDIVQMASPAVAGTVITANTTSGALTADAASATRVAIGYTVEATRLVVRATTPGFDATS